MEMQKETVSDLCTQLNGVQFSSFLPLRDHHSASNQILLPNRINILSDFESESSPSFKLSVLLK